MKTSLSLQRRLWKLLGTALFLSVSATATPAAETSGTSSDLLVYIGTYTGAKSKGIYVSRLDLATGQLSAPALAAESSSPSFLAIHPNHQFLYAVNEVGNFDGKKSGAVASFRIDRGSGRLTLLNQQPSGGDGPCHLNVDATGRAVLVANYGGGSCAAFSIGDDGRLTGPKAFIQHQGSSVNRQRQERPHAHGVYLDARNQFAFVPDLGLDRVLIYRFDPGEASLTPNDPPFASVAPGSGPRHLAFDPANRFAYVINEMACTVTTFTLDAVRGQLQEVQTISTLPAGEKLLPAYSTAEIEVHPSGRFLYGSNRGHDTVVVFAVDAQSGRLSLVQHQSTQGNIPRGFGIDPTGKYLLAANQNSDSVIGFAIDPSSGRLTPVGRPIEVGAPVCVKFLSARP
ncbi:MAG: lactonase family protein [Verrucomicrobiota bacterium]